MNEFYGVLSSHHDYYGKNTPADFTVKLNQPLKLGEGWTVGMCQFTTDATDTPNALVCSDICTTTIVGNSQIPLMKHVVTNGEGLVYYHPVAKEYVDNIRIYCLDQTTGLVTDWSNAITIVTLRFAYNG